MFMWILHINKFPSKCLTLHETSTSGFVTCVNCIFISSAAMADPLTLLRQYYTSGKTEEIVEAEGQIVFGDLAWPKDVRTNFKAYG